MKQMYYAEVFLGPDSDDRFAHAVLMTEGTAHRWVERVIQENQDLLGVSLDDDVAWKELPAVGYRALFGQRLLGSEWVDSIAEVTTVEVFDE